MTDEAKRAVDAAEQHAYTEEYAQRERETHEVRLRELATTHDRRAMMMDFLRENRWMIVLVAVSIAVGAIVLAGVHRERDQRERWCAEHTQDMRCAGLWR